MIGLSLSCRGRFPAPDPPAKCLFDVFVLVHVFVCLGTCSGPKRNVRLRGRGPAEGRPSNKSARAGTATRTHAHLLDSRLQSCDET